MNIDNPNNSIWDTDLKFEADGSFSMRNPKVRESFASKTFSKFGLIWFNSETSIVSKEGFSQENLFYIFQLIQEKGTNYDKERK